VKKIEPRSHEAHEAVPYIFKPETGRDAREVGIENRRFVIFVASWLTLNLNQEN
jgi:hypothetical protein